MLLDDTTDVTAREQCSVSVKYVKDSKVCEKFLGFCDVSSKGITTTTLNMLREIGLDIGLIHGQGYDGASTVSGQWKGVQAEVKNFTPVAPYVHCSSHVLNLICKQLVLLCQFRTVEVK